MKSVVVTGANRGLGLALTRRFASDGWRVHACCRDVAAARDLAAVAGAVSPHELDVRDSAAADRLAAELGDAAVDVLIHNAGISHGRDHGLAELDHDIWVEMLCTNSFAPARLSAALGDHVARSENGLIVMISSDLASLAAHDGRLLYYYRASKAALNMAMRSMAVELRPRGIAVFSVHPGWVRTDMGGPRAPVAAEESAAGIKRIIDGAGPRMSGRFVDWRGEAMAW